MHGAGRVARLSRPFIVLVSLLAAPGILPSAYRADGLRRQMRFRDALWGTISPTYSAILAHPFVAGIRDGTLPREKFRFYLIQDLHYLRAFASALEAAASRAPRREWAELLRRHARESIESEKQMHDGILRQYGVTAEEIRASSPAPTTFAYGNYLLATAHTRPFQETVAALAPCYWIYLEVARFLGAKGSAKGEYRHWIETYSSPAYERDVEDLLAILDAVGRRAGSEQRLRMQEAFALSSRYEWMFWDMAYRMERWPPGDGVARD